MSHKKKGHESVVGKKLSLDDRVKKILKLSESKEEYKVDKAKWLPDKKLVKLVDSDSFIDRVLDESDPIIRFLNSNGLSTPHDVCVLYILMWAIRETVGEDNFNKLWHLLDRGKLPKECVFDDKMFG